MTGAGDENHRNAHRAPKLFPSRPREGLGEGMMTNTPYHASPRTNAQSGAQK